MVGNKIKRLKKIIIPIILITIIIAVGFSFAGCKRGVKPPEGWPLPFNDSITINTSDTRIKGQCGFRIWEIEGTYPGSAEEIYSWYKTNLEDWKIDEDTETSTANNLNVYNFRISNDKYGAQFEFTDMTESKSGIYLFVEER